MLKMYFGVIISDMLCVTILIIHFFAVCLARSPFQDTTDDNFQNECREATNLYRSKHGAPNLEIDQEIIDYAKQRCNNVSQFEGLGEGHQGLDNQHGENLYWSGSSEDGQAGGTSAINSWYNEIGKYNFIASQFSSATGHFTQLVWISTSKMGCARCGGKGSQYFETYIICNYQAPGNVIGCFNKNVLPTN